MGSPRDDMRFERPTGALAGDVAAHVEAIVRAAEREALAAERAIEDRRRAAEDEVHRYLTASRLHVDVEAAARAARLETLSSAARRLADELSDAAAALNRELRRSDDELRAALPRTPWPAARREEPSYDAAPAQEPPYAAAPPQEPPYTAAPAQDPPPGPHLAPVPPQPTWARAAEPAAETAPDASQSANGDVPHAARLVAIEMAVGGASRADVEQHLRVRFSVGDPTPLLDDVFGSESHAGSRLAWGEP